MFVKIADVLFSAKGRLFERHVTVACAIFATGIYAILA
jgi:hypothetical protein